METERLPAGSPAANASLKSPPAHRATGLEVNGALSAAPNVMVQVNVTTSVISAMALARLEPDF